jgi:hypothetical protein
MVAPSVVLLSRAWGLGGWVAMLVHVVIDMVKLGTKGLRLPDCSYVQLAGLGAILFFMAYVEGYRAFYKAFSPMLVRRAMAIDEKSPWHVHILAPFFIGGFFDGTPRRIIVSWGLVVFIAILGISVAHSPWPWHQFIDLGVGVGLSIGIASTAYFTFLAASGKLPEIDGQFRRRETLLELQVTEPSRLSCVQC